MRPLMENAFSHGYKVAAVDAFNDWDAARFGVLAGTASAFDFFKTGDFGGVLKEYEKLPQGFREDPILFCAPVEYDCAILQKARTQRDVLNPKTRIIEKCRDLSFWAEMAPGGGEGITMPETSLAKPKNPYGWIAKNLKSAGGTGIARLTVDDDMCNSNGIYYQRLVEGESIGAVFLSMQDGRSRLIGIARHITGESLFRQKEFLFGGMVYPAAVRGDAVDGETLKAIERFGRAVSMASGMWGWWGADFIVNRNKVYFLEINPRPTASLELVAIAHGLDIVGIQAQAMASARGETGAARKWPVELLPEPEEHFATAVIYADKDIRVIDQQRWFDMWARDIPAEGRTVKKGEPALSFYSKGPNADECMLEIREKAKIFYEGV